MPKTAKDKLRIDGSSEIRQIRQKKWIIWAAILISQSLYLIVGYFILQLSPFNYIKEYSMLTIILGSISILTAIFTFLISQIILLRLAEKGKLDLSSYEGSLRLLKISIVIWFFLESIGIYGLILTILTNDFTLMIPFVIGSLILLLINNPRAIENNINKHLLN
ncbi:MAG: hypothetical protein HQK79_09865 [Desulfobacterales bacterium]|nr:hypothetical protein [Desulfobacterales bacterium]MBF0395138.1 hypothetical protein [Desulfobacterales bacterium]